jgi:hypothetical protein
MKRKITLVLAAVTVGAVLLIILMRSIAATPNDDPGGWRSAVRKYIDYEAKMTGTTLEVAAAEQAARPWEFRREMSIRSFGTSTYYSVDVPYTGKNGFKPLPLPPVEVWCVQLKGKGGSESLGISDRLVLVAKHQDLYNADWITHMPPGGTSLSSAEILALIGCRRGKVPANPQQTLVSTEVAHAACSMDANRRSTL